MVEPKSSGSSASSAFESESLKVRKIGDFLLTLGSLRMIPFEGTSGSPRVCL